MHLADKGQQEIRQLLWVDCWDLYMVLYRGMAEVHRSCCFCLVYVCVCVCVRVLDFMKETHNQSQRVQLQLFKTKLSIWVCYICVTDDKVEV